MACLSWPTTKKAFKAIGFPSIPYVYLSLCRRYSAQAERSRVLIERANAFKRSHTYLRISLTDRCNLRCQYCMPNIEDSDHGSQLFTPNSSLLTTEEIVRLAKLFVHSGVNKIRLTGGEPTVRKDLGEIVRQLSGLNNKKEHGAIPGLEVLAMTSNGVALGRKLKDLVQDGLTHLNLSLDTLDAFKFELITRRPHKIHSAVLSTIHQAVALLAPGIYPALQKLKLNVVVIRNFNDVEVIDFAGLTKDLPLNIRFIEFMPFAGNGWKNQKMVPSGELLERLRSAYPDIRPAGDMDGSGNETAKDYVIPGHKGSIGFISSMSDHFCATCNRLRITADGQIKVCLFDGKEVSLRDKLRAGASDEQLLQTIQAALMGKKARHGGMEKLQANVMENRAMINIGLMGNLSKRHAHYGMRSEANPRLGFINSAPIIGGLRYYASSSTIKPSHLDDSGRPQMVDVSAKTITERSATAAGKIYLNKAAFEILSNSSAGTPKPEDSQNHSGSPPLEEGLYKARFKAGSVGTNIHDKGGTNILTVAQLAGIMAAKSTSSLIPLCHPLPLTHVNISFAIEESGNESQANVRNQEVHSDDAKHAEIMVLQCECTARCSGRTGVEMEALTGVSVALLTVWDMLKAVAGKEMIIGDIKVIHKSGGKSDFVRKDDL